MSNIIEFNKKAKKEPICAFCQRTKRKVPLLIGEDEKPHICSDCVKKCNKLLSEGMT